MHVQQPTTPADVAVALRQSLSGRVTTPQDSDYDHARAILAGGFDRRPAIIARPVNAEEVAKVIALARHSGLPLAIRSGGHTSFSAVDDGIVLDLREMKALDIDAAEGTAWVETGLTAGDVAAAAGRHGLAIGFGDTATVGVGGITLGGGIGYLTRKHGLTIDNLLEAEIVTASGEELRVGPESHPDLFWAIKGGGGNFGVVTRFKFRMHPVSRIVGGMLLLPATADVIAGFVAAAEAAPEELTTIANIMPAPPMPFVPAAHHGKLVVMALFCFAGDAAAGQAAMRPFRALADPIADMVRPMTYPELFAAEEHNEKPTLAYRTFFLDGVDLARATTVVEYLATSDAPHRIAQIRVLGGAMARVRDDATAFAHRSSRVLMVVVAFCQGPADQPRREAWTRDFARALQPSHSGAYVNFVGEEGAARVHDIYPPSTLQRLAAVKAKYDPDNVFRLNQNIAPGWAK